MSWFIGYMLISGLVMAMLITTENESIPDRPVYLWTAMLWPVWAAFFFVLGITWLVGIITKKVL